jgi:hypothetical protein
VKDYSQKKKGGASGGQSLTPPREGEAGNPNGKGCLYSVPLPIRRFDQSCIYMFGKLFAVSIFIAIKNGLAVSLKIKIFSVSNYPICFLGLLSAT